MYFNRKPLPLSSRPAETLAIIVALLGLSFLSVSAQENRAGTPTTELENAFWFCDHAATKGTIDANQGVACGAVTDELKEKMFGGDFDKLLEWWRQNKIAQHQRLDASGEMDTRRSEKAKRNFRGDA